MMTPYFKLIALFFSICSSSDVWLSINRTTRWNFTEMHQSMNLTIVEVTKDVGSLLECTTLCTELGVPYINSLFFTPATGTCHCNLQVDSARSDNDSANPYMYGVPSFNEQIKRHVTLNKTVSTIWPYAQDCLDLFERGIVVDGIYSIIGWKDELIPAQCDMENEGWTIIQHRFDGSVSFTRTWAEYRLGFGDVYGEYWIGFENIHLLTSRNSSMLMYGEVFPGINPHNGTSYNEYFYVHDNASSFLVESSNDIFTGGDRSSSSMLNGRAFSTIDHNIYDNYCPQMYKGGWWYGPRFTCSTVNLHGRYYTQEEYEKPENMYNGILWYRYWTFDYTLKKTQIKVRRVR